MLNISNMTHTALLGQLINTCHISIQLVKRFCKFVDLMLTSHNAVVRHFVRRAIYSAQSPIGRNIAVIRRQYAIHVIDINVKHVHLDNILSVIQSCQEPYGVYWNYCAYPITRIIYQGSPKVMLIL